MAIKLGQKAKDKVTGFTGILTGHCKHLYGCDTYGITPEAVNGEVKTVNWFDEGRIEVIGAGIEAEDVTADKPGGDHRDCPSERAQPL